MDPVLIHPDDSVVVDTETGHKIARRAIAKGENVIKYGFPIGHATADIAPGERVHTENLETNLRETGEYSYRHVKQLLNARRAPTILAYERANGEIGIRNDVWIIPTVGCVNSAAEEIARRTGALAFTHPYGCSQLGGDHETTRQILRGLILHPNAGGVLVLGLGCENNQLPALREFLGKYDPDRIRFLIAQEVGDEIEAGVEIVRSLQGRTALDVPKLVPASRLKIGLKCGGSDGFSGITANPLVGRFSDWLVAQGGTAVLTEVPEMFGAETLLMNRCIDRQVFDRCVQMINGFKDYYQRHGQVIYENPSPGNKAGGISTLEDKSLGCVQKGGSAPVMDVLPYGARLKRHGLNLLTAPGNDMVSSTALAAAGCQMLLFTTGRGTPFGTVIPTVKIATNTLLATRKPHWIDWDAMTQPNELRLAERVIQIASGDYLAQNELRGNQDIAIFKDGVTL